MSDTYDKLTAQNKVEFLRNDLNATAHIVSLYPEQRDWDATHDWLRRTAERVTLLGDDIATLTRDLAAEKERSDTHCNLADAFGDVLCQIAGESDRVRAAALASDRFAAMQRDLAAAREELAAITEHVITSMYGFAPVDSGSQLSGAVKSICDERDELRAQLAAANATVAQCKAAGFIDEQGNVRKVLGTLPLTADGAIVAFGAQVYHPMSVWNGGLHVESAGDGAEVYVPIKKSSDSFVSKSMWTNVSDCYSTRTAAEAAREGKENT